jgi:hypothetical protein
MPTDTRPFTGRDRCQRLWRDCDDDSPWFEKALAYALGALEMGDNPSYALAKIEKALAERPSESAALTSPSSHAPKETT